LENYRHLHKEEIQYPLAVKAAIDWKRGVIIDGIAQELLQPAKQDRWRVRDWWLEVSVIDLGLIEK
jgi:hypothetical protein